MYATLSDYFLAFGIKEASELLSDEEDLVTQENLQVFLADENDSNLSDGERTALLGAKVRLESMISQSAIFMNGYLAKITTLPLAAGFTEGTPIKTCNLELARCQLMDDDDNMSELSETRCKRWRAWLADVANGKVVLANKVASKPASQGYIVGQSHSNLNWGDYP